MNKEEYWIAGIPQIPRTYLAKDWTLVEEEPETDLEKEIDKFIDGLDLTQERRNNMTREEARLTLQDNFGYLINEHPRIVKALKVALVALEQEQPEMSEVDLEKEIDREWEKCNPTDEGMGVETANIHIEAFDMITRHFYELGLKARKEE